MPRKTRMYLPDMPVHVVQRGNNRNACFFCEDEYRYFLERLREGQGRFGVALHAYVLMTNHATPPVFSRLVQHLGRHDVLYINRQYRPQRYAVGRAPQGEPSASGPISLPICAT